MQRAGQVIRVAVAALGVVVAMGACSTPPGTSVGPAATVPGSSASVMSGASYPPPPKRAEIPPPASSPQALWRSGYWSWDGVKYVWVRGHYVQRPSPTAKWIPGYWEQRPEGWMWVEGRWTS